MLPGAEATLPSVFPLGAQLQVPQPTSPSDSGFNALVDQLASPDGQSGAEFPAIVPPAASLSQPSNVPGMGPLPMLGPNAPGPVSAVGQVFKPLGDWLGEVNTKLNHASLLGQDFAAGDNVDIHDVMVATEEADIGMSLTTQIRNKLLDAYQEVMRMQV